MAAQQRPKADHGVYAPAVVRNLTLMGIGFLVLGIAALYVTGPMEPIARVVAGFLLAGFVIGVLESIYMVWSSRVGNLKERERLLDLVALQGDEQVLDVGCGRGLVLTGAARRLTRGRAVGVDIWNAEDQSGNRPEATWENARADGVADRIDLVTGDARALPFVADSFDVIVSSLTFHNIYNRDERRKALAEVLRVLKPGGRLAILDFRHVGDYAEVFRALGAQEVQVHGPHFLMFPPVRIVTGRKPVA